MAYSRSRLLAPALLLAVTAGGLATAAPAHAAPATATSAVKYTVKAGDNLTRIAKTHGTTVAKLQQLNKIKNANRIKVGQVLVVKPAVTPVKIVTGPSTPKAPQAGTPTLTTDTPAWKCQVKSGDSYLQPWVRQVRTRIQTQFKASTIGGYRSQVNSDHSSGLALDVMTYKDKAQGDAVAAWARDNAKQLNVKYVIWQQHIWAPYRDAEGWRPMEDRGSATANHRDHVHISFYSGGGTGPA